MCKVDTGPLYQSKQNSMYARHKVAQPTVFIPVFPGTNCEYDSTKHLKEQVQKLSQGIQEPYSRRYP